MVQQRIQETTDWKMSSQAALAFDEGVSSRSLQPKGKKSKRKYTPRAKVVEKPSVIEDILDGPATMVLDKDETEDDDEVVSVQKRRRKRGTSPAQPDTHLDDIQGLFTESKMVENAESHFQAPFVAFG